MLTKEQRYARAEEMRNKPTYSEKKFRNRLIAQGIDYQSQVVIGYYIVDFLLGSIVVEIDGDSHFEDDAIIYDQKRTKYLEKRGYKVVRVLNAEVGRVRIKDILNVAPQPQYEHKTKYKGKKKKKIKQARGKINIKLDSLSARDRALQLRYDALKEKGIIKPQTIDNKKEKVGKNGTKPQRKNKKINKNV